MGLIFYACYSFQLLEQFTLAPVEFSRSLQANFNEEVALAVTIEHGDAFAANAQRCARLRSFRNFECVFTFECGYSYLGS